MTPGAFVLACLSLAAAAAEAPSSFEFRPSSAAIIGAPFVLEGTARYPERFSLSPDIQALETGPFAVTRVELGTPAVEGGLKVQSVRLTLQAFELGEPTLPPFAWTLSASAGSKESLKSPPVRLKVAPPASAPGRDDDIRDIKGPLWPPALRMAAAGLLLAALLCATLFLLTRRGGGPVPAAAAPPDPRPAHEIALADLEALRLSDLPVKELYSRLADVLRVYLERRYGIPAMLLTTSDLLRRMRETELDIPVVVVSSARELFERADLVKFAKVVPPAHEPPRDFDSAAALVRGTVPREAVGAPSEPR